MQYMTQKRGQSSQVLADSERLESANDLAVHEVTYSKKGNSTIQVLSLGCNLTITLAQKSVASLFLGTKRLGLQLHETNI